MNANVGNGAAKAAAALAWVAAAAAGFAWTRAETARGAASEAAEARRPEDASASRVDVDALVHRLADLEARLRVPVRSEPREATTRASDAVLDVAPYAARESSERILALAGRLDVLEAKFEEMREAVRKAAPPRASRPQSSPAEPEWPALRAFLLDASKPESERVAALVALASTPRSAAIDGAAATAAAELLQGATNADLRAQAARVTSRVIDPALRDACLHGLVHDGAENVREECAESLREYLDVPGVRTALERAAEQDPSEKVRREARRSLNEGSRRR
ncbi:MAG TPA: HEAT repeat domain-containing protein [Planctomycetota bacterium]|nr:HEAT repeat domain-containing protein [Planctomycetota bacterium]